jgi:hypothetical protein
MWGDVPGMGKVILLDLKKFINENTFMVVTMNFEVWNWDMWFGVWLGIMVISLINVVLIVANHNQFLYDWYILGISIIVLIIITILRSRFKK